MSASDRREETMELLDVLQIAADRARLLICGPLLVGALVLVLTYFMTPLYTGVSRILPPQQQQSLAVSMLQSLGTLGGLASAAAGLQDPAVQYVAFFKSDTIADALIERFDLRQRYKKKLQRDTREKLHKRSDITLDKDNIIVIEFDDPDPKMAAAVANAYVEELGKLLDRLAVTEAQRRRLFFEKQLAEAKSNLVDAEKALAAVGVSAAAVNANPSAALDTPVRLRAEITAQEVKLASMRSYMTESAAEYQQAEAELKALQQQLAKAQQRSTSGNSDNDYVAKYRDYRYYETLFEIFSKQYEVAKLDESREGALIQVIDAAQVPEIRSKPKRLLLTLAAILLSGFALLVYAIASDRLAERVRTDPQFAEKLARLRRSVGLRRSLG